MTVNNVSKFFVSSLLLVSFFVSSVASSQTEKDISIQARVDAATLTSNEFISRLGSRLKGEMASGGPEMALSVCRDVAPEIANDLSLSKGWQITRVSNKPRNSMLGMPDEWEQTVLSDFAMRLANGEEISTMSHYEIVDEPSGQSFRYMKAIATGGLCLSCHGSSEQIPDGVKAQLNELYPFDRATDYKLGELRGAISIKQPTDF